MKKITLVFLFATFILNGCEIVGPSIKVEPPKVKVEGVKVETQDTERKEKFCPPGQAKKGNC